LEKNIMAWGRRDLLAGLGLSGLGVPLLGVSGARAAKTRPAAAADAPVTIGTLFPATGPLAAHGDECLRGVILATEACNRAGGLFGRQVVLVSGDAADPDRAVAEARRLIADAQPALLLGTGDGALSLGASEASEGSGVPYWELSATTPAVTTRGFRYLLRVCEPESSIAEGCLDAALDLVAPALRHGPAEPKAAPLIIVLLYADTASGNALVSLVAAAAHRRGLPSLIAIAYQPDAVDFSGIATRLHAIKPDVMVHHGSSEEVVLLYRSLEALRWQPGRIIGTTPAYAMTETAAMIGPSFDGTLAVTVPPYRADARLIPNAAKVAQAYEQRFGAPPRSGYSLSHYAGAELCLSSLKAAGSIDRDHVLSVVRSLGVKEGGMVNGWGALFGLGGENTRAFACVLQWQNGESVALLPKAAAAGSYL
jgi:branched-chain amino acid transport system substrate-binding protein